MFFITSNRAATQITARTEFLDGREYLVAPLTMLTAGVHKGSAGPIFYSANELMKSAQSWNHKPIVVNHPTDAAGRFISAGNPQVLEKQQIGFVLNAKWIGKLVAEAWIDRLKAEKIDKRVATALADDAMMEVSTGLFYDVGSQSGLFNGKPFTAAAINHRPDHLAILPDEVGACSIACGCGLGVNSASNEGLPLPQMDFSDSAAAAIRPFPQIPTPDPTPSSATATPQGAVSALELPQMIWARPQ